MKVADHIADQLLKSGIRRVYGIPGGPSIPYMEAFRRAGIEFILAANEAAAGIMADVSARLTGVPGVCHSTFGPGATNISTGVGSAFLDRTPVIVFTSEMSDTMISRTTQMNISHQELFRPVVKATYRMNPLNADDVIRESLKICSQEYPGPVHIGLPVGIDDSEAAVSGYQNDKPSALQKAISKDRIESMLARSRRPLIAAGLTAKRLGAGNKLISLLNRSRIPVVVTPMAKGIIPEDHTCYAGVLSHALSNCIEDLYEKCDLVIGLGYDQVEYNYESWMPAVPLVHFDTIIKDLPSEDEVAGFAGAPDDWFSLLENLNPASLVFEGAVTEGIRNEMASVFEGLTSHFGPVAALRILKEKLPANSIITADVGSHLHVIGQFWKISQGSDLIITNGWSGMGFGIPAALAAKITRPGSTVACITGDGGFLMMAGEMLTARRYGLPLIVVVLSDGELNLIKLKQSWKGIPGYGTLLYDGDLFGAERFLGVKVIKADSKEKMAAAVSTAISLNEPVIINAIIDPEDYKYLIVKTR